jgi:hypothetical protein
VKARLDITGQAPLLMHNARLSDPLDPIARAMKKISGKRTKTDSDHEELARLEFLGGIYYNEDSGVYVPGANLWATLINGGKVTKQGKAVERGLVVPDNELKLIYDGPTTPEELFADKNFVSRMSVKVGQNRVMRTRPMFEDWQLVAEIHVDETVLNLDGVAEIARNAGEMAGLGDYRPTYGRFSVVVEKID